MKRRMCNYFWNHEQSEVPWEREEGEEGARGRREGGREREFWVVWSLFHFIDGWMGGCGMNTDLQYAAVFVPAAGFQARRLLVLISCCAACGWYLTVPLHALCTHGCARRERYQNENLCFFLFLGASVIAKIAHFLLGVVVELTPP